MNRRVLLTPDQLAAVLVDLSRWSGSTTGIERTLQVEFSDAASTVAGLAELAAELDHHPDVDIRWRTLRIFLTTHSAGGVTELDVEFARRFDRHAGGR